MHTLFDILESSLPAGAELKNKKETSNRFKYDFCFNGISVHGEICKAVAPGMEKSFVARAIATSMSQIYLSVGDLAQGKYWLDAAARGTLIDDPGNACGG